MKQLKQLQRKPRNSEAPTGFEPTTSAVHICIDTLHIMGMQPIWRTKQTKFSLLGIDIYSHVNKSYSSVLQIGCISTDVQEVYTHHFIMWLAVCLTTPWDKWLKDRCNNLVVGRTDSIAHVNIYKNIFFCKRDFTVLVRYHSKICQATTHTSTHIHHPTSFAECTIVYKSSIRKQRQMFKNRMNSTFGTKRKKNSSNWSLSRCDVRVIFMAPNERQLHHVVTSRSDIITAPKKRAASCCDVRDIIEAPTKRAAPCCDVRDIIKAPTKRAAPCCDVRDVFMLPNEKIRFI